MTQQRIPVYDLVRALAIVLIVLIHSSGCLSDASSLPLRLEDALLQSLVAPGVSLFLIISGVLLLGRDEPVGVFFKKRFLRILPPFLFWSLVTFTLGRLMEGNRDFLHFLPDYFRDLATGGIHGIYWFVYMIIGLYLVTPVLRVVCREERALLYLSLFLALLTVCREWLPRFEVSRMMVAENTGCLFPFVAGYAVARSLQNRPAARRTLQILGAVAFLLNVVTRMTGSPSPFWGILTALGLFSFLLEKAPVRISPVIQALSRYSYGIYLSHFLLISAFIKLCGDAIPAAILPFVLAAAVLPIDTALLWLADKLRLGRLVS